MMDWRSFKVPNPPYGLQVGLTYHIFVGEEHTGYIRREGADWVGYVDGASVGFGPLETVKKWVEKQASHKSAEWHARQVEAVLNEYFSSKLCCGLVETRNIKGEWYVFVESCSSEAWVGPKAIRCWQRNLPRHAELLVRATIDYVSERLGLD